MPYSGGGSYGLPAGYNAVSGATILPSQHNPPLEDIAAALSLAFVRDGRAAATGNFALGGFRIIGLADPVDPQDAATKAQLDLRVWRKIRDEDLSSVSTYAVTGLSLYRRIRISGFLYPSSSGAIVTQLSTDNGATYDTTTSYIYQFLNAASASTAPVIGTDTAFPLSGGGTVGNSILNGLQFQVEFDKFNLAQRTTGVYQAYFENSGGQAISSGGMKNVNPVAHNAFRITGSGTISGHLIVEGVLS